mmetsp:Transcript_145975/g.406664  ORF Transcript_145975/g.406664 Transcript_145975/m.406664 type:complete len:441 (+) Transcript_145975:415-1737(+)
MAAPTMASPSGCVAAGAAAVTLGGQLASSRAAPPVHWPDECRRPLNRPLVDEVRLVLPEALDCVARSTQAAIEDGWVAPGRFRFSVGSGDPARVEGACVRLPSDTSSGPQRGPRMILCASLRTPAVQARPSGGTSCASSATASPSCSVRRCVSFARSERAPLSCRWSPSNRPRRSPNSRLTCSRHLAVRWTCKLCVCSASATWSVSSRTATSAPSWSGIAVPCIAASGPSALECALVACAATVAPSPRAGPQSPSSRAPRAATAPSNAARSSATAARRARPSSSTRRASSTSECGNGVAAPPAVATEQPAVVGALGGNTRSSSAALCRISSRMRAVSRWPLASTSRLPAEMACAGFARFQACTRPPSTAATSSVASSSSKPKRSPRGFSRRTTIGAPVAPEASSSAASSALPGSPCRARAPCMAGRLAAGARARREGASS